jgi:hypothetical protein
MMIALSEPSGLLGASVGSAQTPTCGPPHHHWTRQYKFNVGQEMEGFLFSKLRRIVPYFYDSLAIHFFTLVSPLTTRFPLTMVVSSFGPYCCLRLNNAPAECAGVIPTSWTMMPMLGTISYHQGHELLVTPPPHDVFVRFFLGEMSPFPPLLLSSLPSLPLSLQSYHCHCHRTAATTPNAALPPPPPPRCCRAATAAAITFVFIIVVIAVIITVSVAVAPTAFS